MDLSIGKIGQKKNINFRGIKGDYDPDNTQVLRFTPPSYKLNEKPCLEINFLKRAVDEDGTSRKIAYVPMLSQEIDFEDNAISIPQEPIKEDGYDAIAYRYVFKNENDEIRYALDANKKIELFGDQLNLIELGNNYGVTPNGGSMYHAFIDSVGYDPKNIDQNMKNFIRTHANKLGGSIKGLTLLLKQGYFDSYKYIISTPDIGADPTSSHRYWPNNQYQCTNMEDFKDFNFELYKRGKGYVADGAFVSQSLQSPMVQHVLKWGESSPFYHMLKVGNKMQLGVLPENAMALKNVAIKLINSPTANNYEPQKPTLMQFVDNRLVDDVQKEDNQNPITQYAISNPEDHYDSVGYNDTTHPFYFEIDNNDFDKKIPLFKGKNYIMLNELTPEEQTQLFGFNGGEIEYRYQAANATYWDGSVDIVKMNLSNPDVSNPENVKGFFDARNYLTGVATFWTETIQSDLIKRTAKMREGEIAQIAKNAGLSDEDYKLIKDNAINGKMRSLVLEQNKTIEDYVKEFPLQSIETSPELSAIFSEPQFKQELLDGIIKNKLINYVSKVLNDAIPEKYKYNEEYKKYATKIYANEILKTIYSNAILNNSVDKDGIVDINKLRDRATLKSFLYRRPSSPDNERLQVVKKLRKNLLTPCNSAITVKLKNEMKDIKLEDFKLAEAVVIQTKSGLNWRFDAAKDIGDLNATIGENSTVSFKDIWNGTPQCPGVQQFWGDYINNIKKYNPSAYVIAEITCLDSFYNWMNFDSMMNYDSKLANKFLAILSKEIIEQEENSQLAKLAQTFGDLSFDYETRKKAFNEAKGILGKKVYNANNEEEDYGKRFKSYDDYENNLPWQKEGYFLEQIGATTTSNYSNYFNSISCFVGVNPEEAKMDNAKKIGNLKSLKEATDRLLEYSQPNYSLLSHVFVDNHDKPRVLHTFPLDMDIATVGLSIPLKWRPYDSLTELHESKINGGDDEEAQAYKLECARLGAIRQEKIKELTGRDDLQNVNPLAAAVGLMMSDNIDKAPLNNNEKENLKTALRKLVNGGNDGAYDSRARAFGFLPYEITIKDLFKLAGINDEEKIEKFNKQVLETPMYFEDKLWQVLNALTGVPTLYYGTEYAQTGYETHTKNDLVGNRNRALHERKENSIFSDFYNKMNATSALSINPKLSALKNGFPESLEIVEENEIQMYPIYRKDERNSEVISVITDIGIDKKTFSYKQNHKFKDDITKNVSSIPLHNQDNVCPMENGTPLKRMVYSFKNKSYVTEDVNYKIENGAIVRNDGKPIKLNDTVATFYLDKSIAPKYRTVYSGAH